MSTPIIPQRPSHQKEGTLPHRVRGGHYWTRKPPLRGSLLPANLHRMISSDRLSGSQKTIDELSRTRDGSLREDLLEYALGFINRDLGDEDRRFAADFGRRLISAPFVAALPDLADRELIGNAIGFGCDVFCTCDRATIVNKRAQLRQVPLRIMTPAEWWAHVKPWAGLWG